MLDIRGHAAPLSAGMRFSSIEPAARLRCGEPPKPLETVLGGTLDRNTELATCAATQRGRAVGPVGRRAVEAGERCAGYRSRLLVALCALAAPPLFAACSAPVIAPERVAKIEVRNLTAAEKMMEGDEVRKLLEGAVCHQGDVAWRGGYPATIFLDNGRDFEVDGFSYYEPVLRVSRKQWCDLGEKQYKAVFGDLLPK